MSDTISDAAPPDWVDPGPPGGPPQPEPPYTGPQIVRFALKGPLQAAVIHDRLSPGGELPDNIAAGFHSKLVLGPDVALDRLLLSALISEFGMTDAEAREALGHMENLEPPAPAETPPLAGVETG